jgi:hypothetical protein
VFQKYANCCALAIMKIKKHLSSHPSLTSTASAHPKRASAAAKKTITIKSFIFSPLFFFFFF